MDWDELMSLRPDGACPFKPGDRLRFIPGRAVGSNRSEYWIFQVSPEALTDSRLVRLETDRGVGGGQFIWWRFQLATQEDELLSALIGG